ncbi:MAG: XkdX family protein [Aeromonadaceae bacterium]
MSEFAIKIKTYYDNGLWSLARVDKALELKKITQEEYDYIVAYAK